MQIDAINNNNVYNLFQVHINCAIMPSKNAPIPYNHLHSGVLRLPTFTFVISQSPAWFRATVGHRNTPLSRWLQGGRELLSKKAHAWLNKSRKETSNSVKPRSLTKNYAFRESYQLNQIRFKKGRLPAHILKSYLNFRRTVWASIFWV